MNNNVITSSFRVPGFSDALKLFNINIMYTNILSLMSKLRCLELYIHANNPACVLLTETWLSSQIPDASLGLTDYNVYRTDRDGRGGGVCVLLNKSIFQRFRVSRVKVETPQIESLFLQLCSNEFTFSLGCVYRPSSTLIANDIILISELRRLSEAHSNFIVAGDFNFPCISWPLKSISANHSSSGLFSNLIVNSSLVQLVTEPTRFRSGQTPSLLDLVLTNQSNLVGDVQVSSPMGKSDHAVLEFNVQILVKKEPKHMKKKITKIDIPRIKHYLANNCDWSVTYNTADPDVAWKHFHNIVNSIITAETTTFFVKVNPKKPWIKRELMKAIKIKKRLWQKFKATKLESDYREHRKFSNKLSFDLKKAKTQYENSLIGKGNKAIYKYARQKMSSKVSMPLIRRPDGSLSESNLETANLLADYFESVYVTEPPGVLPIINTPRLTECLENVILTEESLLNELSALKIDSAPGPDNITCNVLKSCAHEIVKPLLHIMERSLIDSRLPSDWLKASVTAIFKTGDKTLASNYRPISLTSVCCKILERMICKQLRGWALDHNLIPNTQHAFVPGRSVTSCLLKCVDDWGSQIDNKNPVDVIYLDFEKAFDRVPHLRLITKLENFGIRGPLLKWIRSFLHGRKFYVRVGDSVSSERVVVSGVPQGSVLGPLLFILYISDLPHLISSNHVFYADDCKLYANPIQNYRELQTDLNTVYRWCLDWLIPLNNGKCKVLHLGTNNPKHIYMIDNEAVKMVDSQNDLGVIITSDLSWSNQVAYVARRANSASYMLFNAFRHPSRDTFLKLFKSYIRPILEYANVVWSPILQRDKELLEKVQRRATKKVLGYRTQNYQTRLRCLNLTSLEQRRKRGDLILVYKIFHNPNMCHLKTLFELNTNQLRGHVYKLKKQSFRTIVRRFFFPNRVFDEWNNLHSEIVNVTTVNMFKNKLDQ